MVNKRWTAIAGVLLLAGIVASTTFIQQRNKARQLLSESNHKITDLERRNVELSESLKNQKIRLSAKVDLAEKNQAALKEAENQISELNAALSERRDELDTARANLQQTNGEMERLRGGLASAEAVIAELANKRDQLEEERKILVSHTESMEAKDGERRTAIAMLEKQVEDQDKRITAFEKKIATLSSALDDSSEQLNDLGKDNDNLQFKLKQANHTITGLRDQLLEVITRVPELEDRLERSLKKYQVVHEDLTQAKVREAKLKAQ
jgi:chromosome segregation ATPase